MRRRDFVKARMTLTKNDMARVIVQALYNLPALPAADDRRVLRQTRSKKTALQDGHNLAIKILLDRI